jgi:predicted RNA-binding protein with TRAM domain
MSNSSNYGGRRYGGSGNYGRDRGFGASSGGGGGPKPVEVGKDYDVQISEISRQGDGIARVQGFVIFVKGAKVGEKTKVRILNVGPRFATAQKVEVTTTTTTTTTTAGQQQQQQQQQSSQPSSSDSTTPATSGSKQVAPPLDEQEKPELQDYKSNEE